MPTSQYEVRTKLTSVNAALDPIIFADSVHNEAASTNHYYFLNLMSDVYKNNGDNDSIIMSTSLIYIFHERSSNEVNPKLNRMQKLYDLIMTCIAKPSTLVRDVKVPICLLLGENLRDDLNKILNNKIPTYCILFLFTV